MGSTLLFFREASDVLSARTMFFISDSYHVLERFAKFHHLTTAVALSYRARRIICTQSNVIAHVIIINETTFSFFFSRFSR